MRLGAPERGQAQPREILLQRAQVVGAQREVVQQVAGAGVVGRIDAAEPLVMLGGQRQHAPAQRPQPLDQDVADARIPAGVDRRLGKRR